LLGALDNLFLIIYPKRNGTIFSTAWISTFSIEKIIEKYQPDLINIHWINNGFLSISQIKSLKTKTPIVFTLHDRWLMTGGCHVSFDCMKFKNICSSCIQLNSDKKFDLSSLIQKRKRNLILNRKFSFVGISKWMSNSAKESNILKNENVINLPNPINTSFFNGIDKNHAKGVLGINTSKKILLFGAVNATTDHQKGFHLLKKVINLLNKDNYLIVLFGNRENELFEELEIEIIPLGYIFDEITMRAVINASDVYLLPSLQENLSNSVMESLSCGVPVVSFDVGGNSDMVKHKHTGYLAKPFDIQDFANGIEYLANNPQIGKNARSFVCENFDYDVVAKLYINFFNKLIHRTS
jgi:glycosyltransferase involved in cell wall biosynthesis